MCELILSTNIAWSIFQCKKNLARYYYKCPYVFIQSTRYSYQILMNLNFHYMLLKNPQITDFIKIRPVGAEPSMRTDRNDEANSRTVAFRNFAKSA
jgi:hypothetical protein